MMYDIEDKILFEPDEICVLNRNEFSFQLCNCCGECDDEYY